MPTIKYKFALRDDEWAEYQKRLEQFPEKVKKITDEYMHNDVRDLMIKSITGEMPISDRVKDSRRGHAKQSNWYVSFNFDQAVTIENKLEGKRYTSFYYLFYPHEGTTKQRSNPFMERAMERERDRIVTGLFNVIDREIKEEL